MLNSRGCALSQGEGSDFHPGCNWEATPPGYRACLRAWRQLAPQHRATHAPPYYGSLEKLEKYGNTVKCNRLWEESEMGLQMNWRWDLNPDTAARTRITTQL